MDTSNNTKLKKLRVDDCRLTGLDVSKNLELEYLYCSGNYLDSVFVGNDSDNLQTDGIIENDYLYVTPKQLKEDAGVTNQPVIEKITMATLVSLNASSSLVEESENHVVGNLLDENEQTAWVEGVLGCGVGESIVFDFDKEQLFDGIYIRNGYQKNDDLFYKNSRVKRLRVVDNNGQDHYIELNDISGIQMINFKESFVSDHVTVYIDDVYEGSAYEDTCISEMSFF